MSKLTFKDCAIKALELKQEPMTDVEIWDCIIENGWDKGLSNIVKFDYSINLLTSKSHIVRFHIILPSASNPNSLRVRF